MVITVEVLLNPNFDYCISTDGPRFWYSLPDCVKLVDKCFKSLMID